MVKWGDDDLDKRKKSEVYGDCLILQHLII